MQFQFDGVNNTLSSLTTSDPDGSMGMGINSGAIESLLTSNLTAMQGDLSGRGGDNIGTTLQNDLTKVSDKIGNDTTIMVEDNVDDALSQFYANEDAVGLANAFVQDAE